MRNALLPLAVLLAALLTAVPSHAQDASPTDPPAPAGAPVLHHEEPGLLERGGAIDRFFGDALTIVSAVPFQDLLFGEDPALPWTSRDGTFTITQTNRADGPNPEQSIEALRANWGRLLTTAAHDELLGPWRSADGDPFHLDVTGAAQRPRLPFVVVWLVVAAVFFTVTWRFANLRLFRHAIAIVRGRYDNPDDHGEVTHFQALASALSATVGLGNIAGVAIAISLGGPGATFWMIAAGLLGMSLKFTECTLGQKFRRIDATGRVSGGPMRYLRDGFTGTRLAGLGATLAFLFTLFCIGGSLAGGNSFQVNQSLDVLRAQVPWLETNSWVYGVVMAILVGIVIIGGIRRIAQVAEKIVPAMCGIYVLASLVVILAHAEHVPVAMREIFDGAFSSEAVYGGVIGTLIIGFKRAAFSNEAGVGSAAIAHSAAKTEYPVREGIVALLEPFIDTVVVCTMTALVIIISEVYAPNGANAELVANQNGAALTKAAFESVPWMVGWFPWILTIAVVLFAFSTMISWSYYGERCWTTLFGQRSSMAYKVLFLVFVVLGSIVSARNVLDFGDLMILIMAFPNILGLYLLRGVVGRELREYEQKLRAGEFRTFD
ncbi:MAG: alanine:cation symporter family protein [Planctomycetes bacterium]|nr:alanine:cation symporter family protein [Planctomycetota bacterium]